MRIHRMAAIADFIAEFPIKISQLPNQKSDMISRGIHPCDRLTIRFTPLSSSFGLLRYMYGRLCHSRSQWRI